MKDDLFHGDGRSKVVKLVPKVWKGPATQDKVG